MTALSLHRSISLQRQVIPQRLDFRMLGAALEEQRDHGDSAIQRAMHEVDRQPINQRWPLISISAGRWK